jgi:membrane-bound serine protease (ClpP class)
MFDERIAGWAGSTIDHHPSTMLESIMIDLILPFLLLVLGLGLLVAEDLLPTYGVLYVLAGVCFSFVLYLGFSTSASRGVGYLVAELLLVPLTYGLYSSLISRTGLARLAYLQPPEAHEVDLSLERRDLDRLIGQRGRALTTLRPSGMVDFEGRRLDGVAEDGLIPSGASVLAIQVRTGRLIVRQEHDQETRSRDE